MNKIKKFRESVNKTQTELSFACGWGKRQARLSHYEVGTRKICVTDARTIIAALNRFGADCVFDDVFPPVNQLQEVS